MTPTSFYILDDDADFREDLTEALVSEGHVVAGAGDPRHVDGDVLCHSDVLVLDLALPVIDGFDMVGRIARVKPQPRLIIISGSGEELLRTAGVLARGNGLTVLGTLQKPFGPQDVLHLAAQPLKFAVAKPVCRPSRSEELLPALIDAIDARSLPVMYQPQVTADGLCFAGAEALLGNVLPGVGAVTPPELVAAAATDPQLSIALGHLVLSTAVEACLAWRASGWRGSVSVNMPLEVLLAPDAVQIITAIVTDRGLSTSSVVFELTEDAVYDGSPAGLAALARLRLAGFGLALDDVGKRQSGLLQLANLPVTEIKIDLEFIRQARDWTKPRSIFGSLADLGHQLGVKVVAEGVETAGDLALARKYGVDYVQGYLISHKRPLSELLAMLENSPTPDAPFPMGLTTA